MHLDLNLQISSSPEFPNIYLEIMRWFNPRHTLCLTHIHSKFLPQKHTEVIYGFDSKPQSYNTAIKELPGDYSCGETVKNWENMTLRFSPFQQPQSCEHTDIHRHCRSFTITAASVFLTEIIQHLIPTCTMLLSQN